MSLDATKFTEAEANVLCELAAKLYFALSEHELETNGQSVAEDIIMENINALSDAGHLYYDDEG